MKASIFNFGNLIVNYLPGIYLTKETLPNKSIGLDGIVGGSFINIKNETVNFDHHSHALPRHAQASTVKQVYDALILGWSPPKRLDGKVWVFLNDIDLDSMLALYLLTLNKHKLNRRLKEWVDVVNSSDIFGPAYIPKDARFVKVRDFLYYRILRKHKGKTTESIISSILSNLRYQLNRKNIWYNPVQKSSKNLYVLEKTNFVHPENVDHDLLLMAIFSEDPIFEEAYKQGADLVVGIRRKTDKYKYSIAKRHDFIPYDLLNLLKKINEREKGWGGATSIIGSPENGSILSPKALLHLIKRGEWKNIK